MKYLVASLALCLTACGTLPDADPNAPLPPLGDPTNDSIAQIEELCNQEPDAPVCALIQE